MEYENGEVQLGEEMVHVPRGPSAQSSVERDEKLRESLYELRKMNEVFDGFLEALKAARGHNEVRRTVCLRPILPRSHHETFTAEPA